MAGKEMSFLYCEKVFSKFTESWVGFNFNSDITNCRLQFGRFITGTMLPVFDKS